MMKKKSLCITTITLNEIVLQSDTVDQIMGIQDPQTEVGLITSDFPTGSQVQEEVSSKERT